MSLPCTWRAFRWLACFPRAVVGGAAAGPGGGRLWRGIFHRGARGGMPAGGRDRPAAG